MISTRMYRISFCHVCEPDAGIQSQIEDAKLLYYAQGFI